MVLSVFVLHGAAIGACKLRPRAAETRGKRDLVEPVAFLRLRNRGQKTYPMFCKAREVVMLEPAMSKLNHKLLTIRPFMNTLGPEVSRLPSGTEFSGKFLIVFF
jgi:hypothetical protein